MKILAIVCAIVGALAIIAWISYERAQTEVLEMEFCLKSGGEWTVKGLVFHHRVCVHRHLHWMTQ